MTRDDLVIARWKCAFLARRIAVLRDAGQAYHVVAEIERYQGEMDQLIAVIERTCRDADRVARVRRPAPAVCPPPAVTPGEADAPAASLRSG